VESHDVVCDGPTRHLLVRLQILDGEPVAELQTGAGTRRVPRSAAGRTSSVVLACPCGTFTFDVDGYLAGEWVDPVRIGT
jgi:hypothetical protein